MAKEETLVGSFLGEFLRSDFRKNSDIFLSISGIYLSDMQIKSHIIQVRWN